MDKKIRNILILLVLALVIVLTIIFLITKSNKTSKTNHTPIENNKVIKQDKKILVSYFSATGTTKTVASYISEELNADIYEIVPQDIYTTEDLDYHNSHSRTSIEQNDEKSRPFISNQINNIDEYDIIFLGYPLWHGEAPRIISTFLEQYDFSNKTIIPFCTSHTSGIGNSDTNLHSLVDSSVQWKKGERFSSNTSQKDISKWISGFNLNPVQSISNFNLSQGKNGNAPRVKLNSGYDMPIVGLGTYSLKDDVCINSVSAALERGYRLFDTAYIYDNEESIGEAIRKSNIPREDIFITTKLYPNQFDNAEEAIDQALERLNVDYIDLMLLHHPGSHDVEAYKAMEKAVEEGKIRSIGLSNWYIEEIDEFLPQITITPALIQNEIHPYYQETEVIEYMQQKGIVMQGWYPLGGRGHTKELLSDKTINEIAKKHNRTAAQVILRWNLQKGVIVIPGSSNPDHILENISIFDFELSEEEMNKINSLNRDEKHDWY